MQKLLLLWELNVKNWERVHSSFSSSFCQLYDSFALFEFNCPAFFLKGYYWKGMAHFANEKYIESSECFITALNHTSDDNLKYSTTMKLLHGKVKSGNYY